MPSMRKITQSEFHVDETPATTIKHVKPSGTISAGTLKTEDLIEAFMSALTAFSHPELEVLQELIDGCQDDDDLDTMLDVLFDHLNDIAPSGMYFGAHPDDGADFGFWSITD